MKQSIIITFLLLSVLVLYGQEPAWMSENIRQLRYPVDVFYTGLSQRIIEKGITKETERAKLDAQADLIKQIRLLIKTNTQSSITAQSVNGQYYERESFDNKASAESNAEIVGIKTEIYHDKSANIVYAFAYANKYELIGYYKSNLSVVIGQIESFINTAKDLEVNSEKAKARQQLEQAKPLFVKVRYAQDLLTAIDTNVSVEDLQQSKTENLYNILTQMQARLAQGVYVFVESKEDLFGQKVDIVGNKVKSELAANGCSFVENVEQADFMLKINATTREFNTVDEFVFCYADVKVELVKTQTGKTLYQDLLEKKSGHISTQKAGRNALEMAAPEITKKLLPWVKE